MTALSLVGNQDHRSLRRSHERYCCNERLIRGLTVTLPSLRRRGLSFCFIRDCRYPAFFFFFNNPAPPEIYPFPYPPLFRSVCFWECPRRSAKCAKPLSNSPPRMVDTPSDRRYPALTGAYKP